MAFLTLSGIDEAISQLNINPDTLKGRLIELIRSHFTDDESLQTRESIDPAEIIHALWETVDPEQIRQKKKNLSSLKSALNKTLKELALEGKNPEGIILNRDNIFAISDEHKDSILQQLGLSRSMTTQDLVAAFRELLTHALQTENPRETAAQLLHELDITKKMVAQTAGLTEQGAGTGAGERNDGVEASSNTQEPIEIEEVEIGEDEDFEIREEFITETADAITGTTNEHTAEEVSQTIISDEEEVAEAEILEDDETEIIELDQEVILEETDQETGTADGGIPEAETLEDDEETEIVELDQEVILEETGQESGAQDGDIPEAETLEDDEETEIVELDQEVILEETDDETGAPGGDIPEAETLEDDEETEIVELDQEVILEETDQDSGAPGGDLDAAGGEFTATEKGSDGHGGEGETAQQSRETGHPLDLSHYIDADEALAAPPDTLAESHDEYIAQILERFMPKFIKIPAGHYIIGAPHPNPNERAADKVRLAGFYISQLPVTNDLFDFFVRETGYETDAERAGFGNVCSGRITSRTDPETGRHVVAISRGSSSQRVQGANWRHPAGPNSSLENKANHPVVQVSRRDALAFASWAGKRLPTEDEWEAAARGTEGLLFPWGNEWRNGMANIESSLVGDTTPVIRHGKQSMSPFGLYDLLGNIFEWTATLHHPAASGPGSTSPIYILKGGCWTSKEGITCAARLLERDTWSNIIGFRCAV
ncbi:MAG: hypothetical protein BM485_02980 [Desulfobulbaceae bacterium DB1]|nr:MAG: hypothetical protein BM485_02980 [Desulfobulbaceae bacterium DB1]